MLFVRNNIIAGTTVSGYAYNRFGTGSSEREAIGDVNDANDVYVSGTLEVDGGAYLEGPASSNSVYWTGADIAENLHTFESRKKGDICGGNVGCLKNNTKDNLDFGDLVCMDVSINRIFTKCDNSNSRLVAGFVSETFVLNVGSAEGYPIALAGLVPAHVTNEGGNVVPGDLLVSSSKPGYAMKNNNPSPGTIVGKAYDFCDKEDCKIAVVVMLS
jgi:hypothetical protein